MLNCHVCDSNRFRTLTSLLFWLEGHLAFNGFGRSLGASLSLQKCNLNRFELQYSISPCLLFWDHLKYTMWQRDRCDSRSSGLSRSEGTVAFDSSPEVWASAQQSVDKFGHLIFQIDANRIISYHIISHNYCHHITSISCHLIFPKLSESNPKSFSQLQALELSKASNSSCSPVQSASQTNSTVPSKLKRPAAASAAASALP